MKIFKITFLLLFAFSVTSAFAQIGAIKTGDKVNYEQVNYEQRMGVVQEIGVVPRPAEIEISAGKTLIKYQNGNVDTMDTDHSFVGIVSMAYRGKLAGEQFRWKPASLEPGVKPEVSTLVTTNRCGQIKLAYKDVNLKNGKRTIKVDGKDTEIPVIEVTFDGNWSSSSCGFGKDKQEFVFSPDLGLVIDTKFFNYLPNGNLLNSGFGMRLTSVSRSPN